MMIVQRSRPFSRFRRRLGAALTRAAVLLPLMIPPQLVQAQVFTLLHKFTARGGAVPYSNLTFDAAGNLYGTTYAGGSGPCYDGVYDGCGTVFELSNNGKVTVLHSFADGQDGAYPIGGGLIYAGGNLYGMTARGGPASAGTVFKVSKSGKETVLFTFSGADGDIPEGGLIQDGAGNLYGTTVYGGPYGFGTVFKLDRSGQHTILYGFSGGEDGAWPQAALIQDRTGSLYGTTGIGGNLQCGSGEGCGVVFKLTPKGKKITVYRFAGGTDGANPQANLILDAAGNLYGTTLLGGGGGGISGGTVFKVTKKGVETVLYAFTGGADGRNPFSGVVADTAGNLYGTASNGGTFGRGVVFKVDKTGKETVLHTFTGHRDGYYPFGSVILDEKRNIYGTTAENDGSGYGTIFRLTP